MKTKRLDYRAGMLALMLLGFCTVLSGVLKSMQSFSDEPASLSFVGEYSLDGQSFQKLHDSSRLAGKTLILRGHFQSSLENGALPEGATVNFSLEHLGVRLFVNGEEVWSEQACTEETDDRLAQCGRKWVQWVSTGLTETDAVEIRLTNLHALGNAGAFRNFLQHLLLGSDTFLHSYVEMRCLTEWALGICASFSALLMLGLAISFRKRNPTTERHLLHWGLMVLITGIFFVVDADDFAFRYPQTTVGTYGRQVCLMVDSALLACCVTDLLKDKLRTAARAVRVLLFASIMASLILVLLGRMAIMDTWYVWMPAQLLTLTVLIICCMIAVFRCHEQWLYLGYPLMLLCSAAELLNDGCFGWFNSGMFMKPLFIIVYVSFLSGGFRQLMTGQKKAQEAELLRQELEKSRVTLGLSQIRSHFIFNVLNAVSGMCKYDPEKADETVVRFSRYLRSNVDVLENDALQPFSKELKHVEDYVQLEQMRFGEDKIRFLVDTEDKAMPDFLVPPLLLQPIVENAIQHGLRPLKNGGEIRLHVHRPTPHIVMLKIMDNGVGFDVHEERDERSVGLRNVRFRLETMADGTMLVESTPNVGTTITMTMPFQEVKSCG